MKNIFTILVLLAAMSANAASIISKQTGLFSDTNTWHGLIVPVRGDIVTISNNHTVTFDLSTTVQLSRVTNNGVLYMSNGLPFIFHTTNYINLATAGSNGVWQIGNTDNEYGYGAGSTANGTISLDGAGCYAQGTGKLKWYGDGSHNMMTRVAQDATNGQTYIVVSNVPPNVGAGDVMWIGNTNSGTGYKLYMVSNVIASANSNRIDFEQVLGNTGNFASWSSTNVFTNKCAGGKDIGVGVAFVSSPLKFVNISGNGAISAIGSGTTSNVFSGLHQGYLGNTATFIGVFASTVFSNIVIIGSPIINSSGVGNNNSYYSCYFVEGGAVFNQTSGTNTYIENCSFLGGQLSISTGVGIPPIVLTNCHFYNLITANGLVSANSTGLDNITIYNSDVNYVSQGLTGSTYVCNGWRLNNIDSVYSTVLFGANRCSVNGLNVIKARGSVINSCYSTVINNVNKPVTNLLVGSGYDVKVFNMTGTDYQNDTASSLSKYNYQPNIINNTRWVWGNGYSLLTNNIYAHVIASTTPDGIGVVGTVHTFSVPVLGSRSIRVDCMLTNSVGYQVSLDTGSYSIPNVTNSGNWYVPTNSTGEWTNRIFTFVNTNMYEAPVTLRVIASSTSTGTGYSVITPGHDKTTVNQ